MRDAVAEHVAAMVSAFEALDDGEEVGELDAAAHPRHR